MISAVPPKGSRRKKEADNWLFCWDDSLDKEPNTQTHTHQTHTHFVSESSAITLHCTPCRHHVLKKKNLPVCRCCITFNFSGFVHQLLGSTNTNQTFHAQSVIYHDFLVVSVCRFTCRCISVRRWVQSVSFLGLFLSLFLSCAPRSAGLFCNIASLCVVLTSDGLWPRCELAGCSLPLWKDCYSDLWPLCWRSVLLLLFVSLADLSFPFLIRALSCLRHFPSNIMFGVVSFTAVK